MERNSSENARKRYTQAVLSCWGDIVKQGKEDGGSSSSDDKANRVVPKKFWEQEAHIIFVPVVIKSVKLSDTEYECDISIPLDVDVPIRIYRPRSEKMSQFVTYLLAEKAKDNSPRLRMVSGISEAGVDPLSPSLINPLGNVLAYVYSRVLGIANRAARCKVFESKDQARIVNARVSEGGAQAQKDLGKHKKSRRGEKIRKQVLPETLPEESSEMVGMDGKILGK